ncbi:uncharacterized protein LOC133791544 [Humulus lupulus]|uniref:uncharacterized protein LOC133791544 n=1 Tax=Humulus lupulus TaxID=3486 RepID=UPI002B400F81|nr:uncharacterized protein LOC133791544 [Humulus lupulus]
MKEVVKTEVLKLLDSGIIYSVADIKWVSPTQVVPKKLGVTVEQNEKGELVPTKHMPFGLCNAPTTFQLYMMSIFRNMIKKCMEVFMDDMTFFGDSIKSSLLSLESVLKRCKRKAWYSTGKNVISWCHMA